MTFRCAVSQSGVLSEELFDAWNQFQLFFSRQILILIQQQLELVLEALNECVQSELVLIIRQFGQFLHRAVGLVSSEHNRVEDLGHYEKVVDFFAENVLQ